jgi:hypothetical protein
MRALLVLAFLLALAALAAPATAAEPNVDLGIPDIMKPEPGTKPEKPPNTEKRPKAEKPAKNERIRKRASTRGSSVIVRPAPLPPPLRYRPQPAPAIMAHPPAVPPPMLVPQTGQVLPNLPAPVGSGPNGSETYQDRAARCAHQAGVYGSQAGNRNAYVGGCINQ